MKKMVMSEMSVQYDCVHEDLIASHSTDIESLKTRADYKSKRLDDLDLKIEKVNEKLDKMNDNINKLIQASMKSDADLEKRLVAMETKIAENDKAVQDNRNRFTIILSMVIVFFTALTFIFNFILR